jgi:hypothetical protein
MKTARMVYLLGCLLAAAPALPAGDKDGPRRAAEAIEGLGGRVRLVHPAGATPYVAVFWDSREPADKDLARLKELRGLGELILDCPNVTDAGLDHLKGLKGLRELRLYGQRFTDKGMARVTDLTELRALYVMAEGLTDDGLAHLKGLASLERLVLASPKITDAGLRHLRGLKKLRELDLGLRSKVTAEGAKELQKALPDVIVTR